MQNSYRTAYRHNKHQRICFLLFSVVHTRLSKYLNTLNEWKQKQHYTCCVCVFVRCIDCYKSLVVEAAGIVNLKRDEEHMHCLYSMYIPARYNTRIQRANVEEEKPSPEFYSFSFQPVGPIVKKKEKLLFRDCMLCISHSPSQCVRFE